MTRLIENPSHLSPKMLFHKKTGGEPADPGSPAKQLSNWRQ